MSADITADPAIGATSIAFPRHEQTFPTLTPAEIERMRRFGELRTYRHGCGVMVDRGGFVVTGAQCRPKDGQSASPLHGYLSDLMKPAL